MNIREDEINAIVETSTKENPTIMEILQTSNYLKLNPLIMLAFSLIPLPERLAALQDIISHLRRQGCLSIPIQKNKGGSHKRELFTYQTILHNILK